MTVTRRQIAAADLRAFADAVCADAGAALIFMAGEDRRTAGAGFLIHYVFARSAPDGLLHASVRIDGDTAADVPSLGSRFYPASRFEREIQDLFGIGFAEHPDPRALVKHAFWPADAHPLRKDAASRDFADDGRPFPFTEVEGEGVYEIPVGPVHAGVIEPGHFRFSVMGETIIDMKSRLYFTHKGTEKLFEGRAPADAVALAERISGDTSVGHALAYCRAVESAGGIEVPIRAQFLRVVLLELERLYNHVGDFGAIANDTGFAVAQAHCLRIRERLLRLNKEVTGSRLLRGVLCPGGLQRDLAATAPVAAEIDRAVGDFNDIVSICFDNTLVRDRLRATGILTRELADDYGVLGFVARASGRDVDARRDHPSIADERLAVNVIVEQGGDVYARAAVRVGEVQESARLIRRAMEQAGSGPIRVDVGRLSPFEPAFGIVEGWRGRIVHAVIGGIDGTLHRVKVVDPSFFNWPALSHVLRGNIVPDFPLCNKSFNQSYSGNDL